MKTTQIPGNFYRVSAKALILNKTKDKFLVIREDNGLWEIPGGGIDWAETVEDCITRELKEECGLTVTKIAKTPKYYLIGKNMSDKWSINLVFETEVANLNFTPGPECEEIAFINKENVHTINAFRNVLELAELFYLDKDIS